MHCYFVGNGIARFVDLTLFDMVGSHNDINMLNCSPVFNRLMESSAPMVSYEMEMHMTSHTMLVISFILTGPHWLIQYVILKEKQKRFPWMKEACRKDVKRAFNCLNLGGLFFVTRLEHDLFGPCISL
jgi:hypothetical protein